MTIQAVTCCRRTQRQRVYETIDNKRDQSQSNPGVYKRYCFKRMRSLKLFSICLRSLASVAAILTPFTASAHVTNVCEMSLRVPFALAIVVLSFETTVATGSGSNCMFPTPTSNKREIGKRKFSQILIMTSTDLEQWLGAAMKKLG